MLQATKTVIAFIENQVNFNGLHAIQGALAGFYTSPLLSDFGVDVILDSVKACDKEAAASELAKQFKALNEAKKASMVVVGSVRIQGVVADTVRFIQPTVETVKSFREGV